jgi:SAM-dependent methyltransferase
MTPCVGPLSPAAQCRRFLTQHLHQGEHVLDIGCGTGELLREYLAGDCEVVGLEIDDALVLRHRAAGLDVRLGRAEELPFADASFDRILCSVVVPYTDEQRTVAEWSRVLRPGGIVLATYHGLGYGLRYLCRGESLWQRVYGGRMLLNTLSFRATRRRLPGFLGDTLCQSSARLVRQYRAAGLELQQERVFDRFGGLPRFFGHRIDKPTGMAAATAPRSAARQASA